MDTIRIAESGVEICFWRRLAVRAAKLGRKTAGGTALIEFATRGIPVARDDSSPDGANVRGLLGLIGRPSGVGEFGHCWQPPDGQLR